MSRDAGKVKYHIGRKEILKAESHLDILAMHPSTNIMHTERTRNFWKFEYLTDRMAPTCVMSLSRVLSSECAAGYVCVREILCQSKEPD